jgi:hypothetical protein
MKIKETLEQEIKEENSRRDKFDKCVSWLQTHAEELDAAGVEAEIYTYTNSIDFNNLPHNKIVKVMVIVKGGEWKKEYRDNVIDYTTTVGGLSFRCWAGEPPSNCILVEELVVIPSTYVPEHTEKRLKLQCIDKE